MVRILHEVERRTNEDVVKCLANAFDEYANLDFGGLA
jgi:hypothetical protein